MHIDTSKIANGTATQLKTSLARSVAKTLVIVSTHLHNPAKFVGNGLVFVKKHLHNPVQDVIKVLVFVGKKLK